MSWRSIREINARDRSCRPGVQGVAEKGLRDQNKITMVDPEISEAISAVMESTIISAK